MLGRLRRVYLYESAVCVGWTMRRVRLSRGQFSALFPRHGGWRALQVLSGAQLSIWAEPGKRFTHVKMAGRTEAYYLTRF